jgi:hypothetical protein
VCGRQEAHGCAEGHQKLEGLAQYAAKLELLLLNLLGQLLLLLPLLVVAIVVVAQNASAQLLSVQVRRPLLM